MKKLVIPSIIAKSQKELDKRIRKLNNLVKYIQLDLMDGKFVRNKSLNFNFKVPSKFDCEAHLMIESPKNWIIKNANKINTIIFHIESCKSKKEVLNLINFIKSKKKKVGIAINPKTEINRIEDYIKLIDVVLIMTVSPGKYGSKFLPKCLEKVKYLRKKYHKLNIEVDGGINNKTIHIPLKSGANKFVVGSYLQKSKNFEKNFKELKQLIK